MRGDGHEPVAGGIQHAEHLPHEGGPAADPAAAALGARADPLYLHARRQAPNRRRGQGFLFVSMGVEGRRGEREREGYGHRRRRRSRRIGSSVAGAVAGEGRRGEGEMGEDVGGERLHRVTGGVEERERGPFLDRG